MGSLLGLVCCLPFVIVTIFLMVCGYYSHQLVAYREQHESVQNHNQWVSDNKIEPVENNSNYWRN